MTIWVVRHGSAGRKGEHPGNDDLRPLDALGHEQAARVSSVLGGRGLTRLLSSPTRRCVDTLVPLAQRLGTEVQPCPAIGVDGHPDGLLAVLADASPGDVLCTHGELMRPALHELQARGAVVGDHDEEGELLAKGCVWELDLAVPRLVLL